MDLFNKIKQLLDDNKISYQKYNHPPTKTSEESAKYRGVSLKIGAKAILLKDKKGFLIAVVPADRRLDSKKLKKVLQSKKLRFSTEEELKELTGCDKGSLPPFGSFFNLKIIADKALFEEEEIAFNAGSLENSIKMKTKDYTDLVNPQKEDISVSNQVS